MTHCVAIPPHVNPAIRPALDALAASLVDRHYSFHAAGRIVAYAEAEGTLAGAPLLEPEDEAAAEAAYVAALEPIGSGPADWPASADNWRWESELDAEDLAFARRFDAALELAEAGMPAPICGGAPEPGEPGFEPSDVDREWAAGAFAEPEPFVPSAADLAEMHAHRDAIEPMYGYE